MRHIRTLGLVFIALGMIEIMWVLFCIFGGVLLGGVAAFGPDEPALWLGTGAYWLLALFNAPIAMLHLFAGARLSRGRGLYVAIAAIAACLPALIFALYCSPFELAAAVYGLVVLLLPESREILDPIDDF